MIAFDGGEGLITDGGGASASSSEAARLSPWGRLREFIGGRAIAPVADGEEGVYDSVSPTSTGEAAIIPLSSRRSEAEPASRPDLDKVVTTIRGIRERQARHGRFATSSSQRPPKAA